MNQQTEAQRELQHEIELLIKSFFQGMTAKQWELLKRGTTEDSTKILLAELILDIIVTATKAIWTWFHLYKSELYEDFFIMGDVIIDLFSDVLNIQNREKCESAVRLVYNISSEIEDSVKSVFTSSKEGIIIQHFTAAGIINTIVCHAIQMLKELTANMKTEFSPRTRRQRTKLTSALNSPQHVVKPSCAESGDRGPHSPVINMKTVKYVKSIIEKNLKDIMDPLFDDVPDFEYERLESVISQEAEDIAENVAFAIAKDNRLEKGEAAGPSPTVEQTMREIGGQIEISFAKSFAKMWLHLQTERLMAKYNPDANVERDYSGQSDLSSVIDKMMKWDKRPQAENNASALPKFQNYSENNSLIITEELSDLLYNNILQWMAPEVDPLKRTYRTGETPTLHTNMYAAIQRKVLVFLRLQRWWQITQVGHHAKRLRDSIAKAESPELPLAPVVIENTPQSVPLQSEPKPSKPVPRKVERSRRELAINLFVEMLLTKLCQKARMSPIASSVDIRLIMIRIIERTWAEVKDLEFEIKTKTCRKLEKAICKELCKNWGSAKAVLLCIKNPEPDLENFIAFAVKRHLRREDKSYNGPSIMDRWRNTKELIIECYELNCKFFLDKVYLLR